MFHVVLVQPEIPQNTGAIIRLCANSGAMLHLIHPLSFEMSDKKLRRAGLDYHEWASVKEYPSFDRFLDKIAPLRIFALSTHGQKAHSEGGFQPGDALVFGSETKGLGDDFLSKLPPDRILRIPMLPNSRSMNLSNSVAVVVYEAWRQCEYSGK